MKLADTMIPPPTCIYNDNAACVAWAHSLTTKGLRHIQMRENAVREEVQDQNIQVQHIPGKLNISDMFTKEDKDSKHFIEIRDYVLTPTPSADSTPIITQLPIASKGGDVEGSIPVE